MKKLITATAVVIGLSQQNLLAARESPFDFGGGNLTFYLDNDLFGNRDQDYTNGARISWISSNRKMTDIGAIQRALRPFTGDEKSLDAFQFVSGFDEPDKILYNYGFSLTQLMFTPEDYTSLTQPEGERRYAGWTSLGFSLHTKDDKRLNSIEFMFGILGKHSYAQEVQDFVHDIKDSEKFLGWDDQVPTEVTFDLSFVQKRRIDFGDKSGMLGMDGFAEWGARLGSFRTTAHVGGTLRFGFHLPSDFSDPRLSETAYAHTYFGDDGSELSPWSLYFMTGIKGTGIAHDATLDGPLFKDFETGNTREPFVGEFYAGIGWRIRSVEISYAHTWRTEEYKEQPGDSNFGTVSVRFQF
jgi:hypothetical protein